MSNEDDPTFVEQGDSFDERLIDDLQAACNSLGKLDQNDGTYMKNLDCKACLKEIIKLLEADTKRHNVRIALASLNIIRSDLIPILNQYCDFNEGDIDLFKLIIRISANLTSSILLLVENQEIPTDPSSIKIYNQLLKGLYGYKLAFADDPTIWDTLNTHLRHTEDEIPFERLLILLRNILHIPVDSSADLGIHNEFDTHGLCLYRMQQSGMFHTIIEIASETQRGSEFCFHIIEIVHLMLRDQNPLTVATAQASRNKRRLDEEDEDKKRLAELSAQNRRERQSRSARYAPPRFRNSMFVLKGCQSIGDDGFVISNKIVSDRSSLTFDAGKTQLRKSKNKKPLSSEKNVSVLSDRNTKPSQITYSIKSFSKLFVEKIYANYMQQIKHNLIQKKAAENDESYYLWAIQYFTAFCRHMQMSYDFISETVSTSTLHFIQILISDYQDKIKIEKKRCLIEKISKRLHLAVRAYREILYLIQSIKEGSELWDASTQIKKTIFSEQEYSNLIYSLLLDYEESKYCTEYLRDIVRTNDIFLDLLAIYHESKENFISSFHRYCNPNVIKAYASTLEDYKTNDRTLNHQLLKFFEKVAYDCKSSVMLLQASFLHTLLDIAEYHSSMPDHDGFMNLTKHLMETFTDMMSKKRWMIQELLFWKTNNDVIEIENAVDPPPPPPAEPEPEVGPEHESEPVAGSPVDDTLPDLVNELASQSSDDERALEPAIQQASLDELMDELGSDSEESRLPSPELNDSPASDQVP